MTSTKLVLLAALTMARPSAQEAPPREQGAIADAEYRIDIPRDWNGGLMMFAHGYNLEFENPEFNERIVVAGHEHGYAVAQSKYSLQGWAVREGVLETEALRAYFERKYGKAEPTIIVGTSMGGMITLEILERYPEAYDGGLMLCSAGQPALNYAKSRLFDLRVLFDYYFPGLPGSAVDFPLGRDTASGIQKKAQELVDSDRERAKRFAARMEIHSVDDLAPSVAEASEVVRELIVRAGGNPFDNRNTVYAGIGDDWTLNETIGRYAADPDAVEYVRQWGSYNGGISDPLIMMSVTRDWWIPRRTRDHYAGLAQLAGTSELLVLQYVDDKGHCSPITDNMISNAIKDLDVWVRDGTRPKAGAVR